MNRILVRRASGRSSGRRIAARYITAFALSVGLLAAGRGGAGWSQEPAGPRGLTIETSAAARFNAGRRWAVVIGVNKYLDPQIPSLEFCVADAQLMAKTLTEKCGYETERILVLTDRQPLDHLQPLGINLRKQIPGWLKNAQPGDTVLVFFSGHGFLDDRGQGFLAPKDCEKANLGLTGYRTDDLRDSLQQCRATQKLLVLDCCHAGAEKGVETVGTTSAELGAAFARAKGLITLASCAKNEQSQEWRQRGQGLFTMFLAEGLAGAADFDHDGLVDSDELYRYALDKVSTTAQRELNAQQTPVRHIPPDVVGVFALARRSDGDSREAARVLTNSIGMKFSRVAAGEFTMGSPAGVGDENEHPAHRVTIGRPFYLAQTEVTQRQFEAVMHANPSAFSAVGKKAALVAGEDTGDYPVDSVSYDQALEFCKRLAAMESLPEGSYRLPTEAQWEYAARAAGQGSDADSAGPSAASAWTQENSEGRTHPVAQKTANRLGLYDMSGNVAEWCGDWFDEGYYGRSDARDPVGPAEGGPSPKRVLRGGHWLAKPPRCRAADRDAAPPAYALNCYGFRVARTVASAP